MNKILYLLMVFFSIQMVSAQEATTVSNDKVYSTSGVDIKPEFPGGVTEFYRYIGKNYKLPNVEKLAGKIYVTFVIEIDGSITGMKVLRDIGYGTGEEAIRVLSKCPKWIPGEHNGQKVRCTYSLPISVKTN
jgi:protein TonB